MRLFYVLMPAEVVSAFCFSEDDGIRTRNFRIDSPVL